MGALDRCSASAPQRQVTLVVMPERKKQMEAQYNREDELRRKL